MKQNNFEINQYRIRFGYYCSDERHGNNGAFVIPFRSYKLTVIDSDGAGWDHVSVSLKNRCPNWEEMCFIKDLFFYDNETVIQYHPKKSEYINCCENCLHLWRKQAHDYELPPQWMIAPKDLTTDKE